LQRQLQDPYPHLLAEDILQLHAHHLFVKRGGEFGDIAFPLRKQNVMLRERLFWIGRRFSGEGKARKIQIRIALYGCSKDAI
jgi:hypothetical protein